MTVPTMTELPGESAAPAVSAAIPEARPGVPLWRVGKPDAFLAAEVATARTAVQSIAGTGDIGKHLGARSEGVRCVTHLFECQKPGYRGWVWFATLARVSRGKAATVNELGLLPTEDSVLAPAWVPWSERVRPEDQQEADAASGQGAPAEQAHELPASDDAAAAGPGAAHADDESADAQGHWDYESEDSESTDGVSEEPN